MKTKPQPCRCPAYPFPHREGSLKCAELKEQLAAEPKDPRPWWEIAQDEAGMSNNDFY